MKLSLSWISDFVDLKGISTDELVHRLTMSSCEVEEYFETHPFMKQLIVAQVKECEKHPDSDHLSKCVVFDGKTDLSVICGASNVRAGILVAFAPVGTVLPTADGNLKIEKRKIRGVVSEGMICSAKELYIDSLIGDNGGIIILDELNEALFQGQQNQKPDKTAPASKKTKASKPSILQAGLPLDQIFGYNDTVIDIDNKSITHRPDLWCHFGFAREIAAIFKRKLIFDPVEHWLKTENQMKPSQELAKKKIEIQDDTAFTYQGVSCDNVLITDSPILIKQRLAAVGQKLINNVVDVSNYVLYEIGQPNHCFDASLLSGNTIVSAASKKPVKFTGLDENEYQLPKGAVFIYDTDSSADKPAANLANPVALAGIIGGQSSSIQNNTTSIFIESATFHRESIRQSLSAGAPRTESARRFEKGQDPHKAKAAVFRILDLLQQTSPNLRRGALTEAWTVRKTPKNNTIKISLDFLQKRLGFALSADQFKDILTRLYFTVDQKNDSFTVTVPSFRSYYDVQIPEDLIEEIGRIYGYDNIKPQPAPTLVVKPRIDYRRLFERRLKTKLTEQASFTETMNYSFASADDNQLFGGDGINLKNPVQNDKAQMRRSQIPGIIAQSVLNQDRFDSVSLFELGRVFLPSGKKGQLPTEDRILTIIHIDNGLQFTDHRSNQTTATDRSLSSFLTIRSRLETVLRSLDIDITITQPSKPGFYLHPMCQVEFQSKGIRLGVVGLLHPDMKRRYGVKRPVAVLAEFDFESLFQVWDQNRHTNRYQPPSVYPASNFELTLLLSKTDSTQTPVEVMQSVVTPELQSIELLTLFSGAPIDDDKVAASYSIKLQSKEGSISSQRQQQILISYVDVLAKRGFILRGENPVESDQPVKQDAL